MISMEVWLLISMVATLIFWGVVIGARGLLGGDDTDQSNTGGAHTPPDHDMEFEQWGRDLWRVP